MFSCHKGKIETRYQLMCSFVFCVIVLLLLCVRSDQVSSDVIHVVSANNNVETSQETANTSKIFFYFPLHEPLMLL